MSERLRINGLRKAFGGLAVTRDVSFGLQSGERVALIGPNGAGKSTLINLVTGLLAADGGEVRLDGQDVTRTSATARVRAGLVRSFQISRLFQNMTVRQNLRLAVLQRQRLTARCWRPADQYQAVEHEAASILDQLSLSVVADDVVHHIAYGQQRLTELALALALNPGVLLLDEPAAGVPQSETGLILNALERLPAGIAILMVEHDMDLVFRFASRVLVLAAGELIFEGTPDELVKDSRVRVAYLGGYRAGDSHRERTA